MKIYFAIFLLIGLINVSFQQDTTKKPSAEPQQQSPAVLKAKLQACINLSDVRVEQDDVFNLYKNSL